MGFLDIGKMANLDRLKQALPSAANSSSLTSSLSNIGLKNISVPDLKSLMNPKFLGAVGFGSLPFASLDSSTMNKLYPGSIDEGDLQKKICNTSITKGTDTTVGNTEAGPMAVKTDVKTNCDVEDHIADFTNSQGTNMQYANRTATSSTKSSSSSSLSFIGQEVVK